MKDERVRQAERVAAVVAETHGNHLEEIAETMLGRELTEAEDAVLDLAVFFGSMLTAAELLAALDRRRGRRRE